MRENTCPILLFLVRDSSTYASDYQAAIATEAQALMHYYKARQTARNVQVYSRRALETLQREVLSWLGAWTDRAPELTPEDIMSYRTRATAWAIACVVHEKAGEVELDQLIVEITRALQASA